MKEAPPSRPGRLRSATAVVVLVAALLALAPAGVQAIPGQAHDDLRRHGGVHGDAHSHAPTIATGGPGPVGDQVQVVPGAGEGFLAQPLAPATIPTVLSFGPDPTPDPTGGEKDLYLATLTGEIQRLDLAWTPVGPVVTEQVTLADGFNLPLGVAFDAEQDLYVSDSYSDPDRSHPIGVVYKVDPATGDRTAVVDGLPNGQHNTNHIRIGPEGQLWLPVGNPNDHGNGTGTGHADIFPVSGAFLTVDPTTIDEDPVELHWETQDGDDIPFDDLYEHDRNTEFRERVGVYAYGFRNIFGVTWAPSDLPFAGAAYTSMNGADAPASQDSLYKITPGAHHGFPFCYNEGEPGATGDAVEKVPAPDSPNPSFPCDDKPAADALLGWHICATGLDFPTDPLEGYPDASFPEPLHRSVYTGECSPFALQDTFERSLEHPTTHNTGHKVARVALDDAGEATEVKDFVTGLTLPTDVQFGPDGAMYIADAEKIVRVAGTPVARQLATLDELAGVPALTQQDEPFPVLAAGQSFLPQATIVPVGEPIEWTKGPIPHTVTTSDELCPVEDCDARANDPGSEDDGDPDTFDATISGGIGGTFEHAFTAPGVYPYFCRYHDSLGMVGLVVAVDPGDPTAVGPQDILDALPAG